MSFDLEDLFEGQRGRDRGSIGKKDKSFFNKTKALLKKSDRPKASAKVQKDVAPKEKKGGRGRLSSGSHYPFKRRSELGPTRVHQTRPPAPPPRRTRVHKRADQWSCKKIGEYRQMCIGIGAKNKGQRLPIKINRAYKKRYNKAFKRHRTQRRAEARRQGRVSPV